MSQYLNRMLLADERVVYAAELHWIVYHNGIMLLICGALLGHYAAPAVGFFLGSNIEHYAIKPFMFISIAIIAWGALDLLISFIRQISTELVITNRRVIAKYGFIATTTFELMITKVEGANIDQTVLGRMLGFGTVMVKGTGGGIAPIDHIANPYRFHSFLMQGLQRAQQPDRTIGRND